MSHIMIILQIRLTVIENMFRNNLFVSKHKMQVALWKEEWFVLTNYMTVAGWFLDLMFGAIELAIMESLLSRCGLQDVVKVLAIVLVFGLCVSYVRSLSWRVCKGRSRISKLAVVMVVIGTVLYCYYFYMFLVCVKGHVIRGKYVILNDTARYGYLLMAIVIAVFFAAAARIMVFGYLPRTNIFSYGFVVEARCKDGDVPAENGLTIKANGRKYTVNLTTENMYICDNGDIVLIRKWPIHTQCSDNWFFGVNEVSSIKVKRYGMKKDTYVYDKYVGWHLK